MARMQTEYGRKPHRHHGFVRVVTVLMTRSGRWPLRALQPEHFEETQRVLHRFIVSPFIQNRWRSRWSREEILAEGSTTFLVHGGTEKSSP